MSQHTIHLQNVDLIEGEEGKAMLSSQGCDICPEFHIYIFPGLLRYQARLTAALFPILLS